MMSMLITRGSMNRSSFQEDQGCARSIRGRRRSGSAGFTLIEVLIGIGIVAVLVTIAYPLYTSYVYKANIVHTIGEIKDISEAIELYVMDNKAYPDDLTPVNYATLLDPWGSLYQYINIDNQLAQGKKNPKCRKDQQVHPLNTDYDLYSMGKDRDSQLPLTAKASRDDIIRANNGEYIGLASDF